MPMLKALTMRVPDELAAKVEAEMERRKVTAADIMRQALEDYFSSEKGRQNDERVLYEIIRTRAVLMRRFDMESPKGELPDDLLEDLYEAAGKDVNEYLAQRKTKVAA